MSAKYPYLIFKGHSYYMRVALAKHLHPFARCREIRYSLQTADFKIATTRWKTELWKIQQFCMAFEYMCTLLFKDKTDDLLGKLEQITAKTALPFQIGEQTIQSLKDYLKAFIKKDPKPTLQSVFVQTQLSPEMTTENNKLDTTWFKSLGLIDYNKRAQPKQNQHKTPWQKVMKRFLTHKANKKVMRPSSLDANKRSLFLIFTILRKDYIEDITEKDCLFITERLHNVSRHWGNHKDKILRMTNDSLCNSTIRRHLITFREFMRFAVREKIITNAFNEMIDLPQNCQRNHRSPFTDEELKKIFNPNTYPNPAHRRNQAKFWIPLIALYQGCRQNEICQLNISDIIVQKGVPCFHICADSVDKFVKTEASDRIIPIHPALKQLGFLDYVQYQQEHGEHKVFSCLTNTKRNGYGRIIQGWFARYLDRIGITSPDKVFHSFRHTFECKAIEKRLHTEHQNALGGWTNKGIGQRVYGRHLEIKALHKELSKIAYPLADEMKELEQEFRASFVYRFLATKG